MKSDILLVHGAWQGAWAWKAILDILKDRRIRARAFDLPGSGGDRTPVEDVTLQLYADSIIAQARSMNSDRLVVVGHSMGGAAITAAASQAPELFTRLIYVCAFLPRPGESVADLGKESHAISNGGPQVVMTDNATTSTLVHETIAETFLKDCSPETVAWAVPQFRPQPIKPIMTPIAWSAGFEKLPKDYILCTKDHAIDPQLQVMMADRAGVTNVHKLVSGHEPFLSLPTMLADFLNI